MKFLKFTFVIIFINLIYGCGYENQNDIIRAQIKHDTNIEVPEFTIVEQDINVAFGDYAESFTVQFDFPNFNDLKLLIVTNEKYGWTKYESGHKFLKNSSNGVSEVYFVNDENRTLNYLFVED